MQRDAIKYAYIKVNSFEQLLDGNIGFDLKFGAKIPNLMFFYSG